MVDTASDHLSSNGVYVTDANGEIRITGVTGTIVVTEEKAPAGHVLDPDNRTQTVVVNTNETQTLVFYNPPTQALTLHKYEAGTTTPIAGVAFKITSSDGTVLGSSNGEFVTDRSGQIVLSGLTPGITVTAQEIRTVSGYVLDATPQSILIKSGEAQQLVFFNEKKGALIIEKRDSITGELLPDAEFKITTIDGEYVDDDEGRISTQGLYKTGSDGKITLTKLPPNTYVISEVKAPDGYVLDKESRTVKVNSNNTQTIVFKNTTKQSVTIEKYIDGTDTPLPGVTFLVTDASGAPVGSPNGEHVTDANGRIVLTGLTPGMVLTVREVKTVKGYTLYGKPQTIVVGTGAASGTSGGTGNTLVFYDDPLSILIVQKYVTGTTTPISGVRFFITDGSGAAVGTTDGEYSTDEHGQIVLRDLEPGTVIHAREIKAADGYVLDGGEKSITIKSGDVQTLEFFNSPTGTLILTKRDRATDKPLSSAKFQITDSTGAYVGTDGDRQTSNGEYITGEDGTIRITGLQPCTLVIREVKAPDGYTLNPQPLTVEIKANDTQRVNFYDDATQTLTIQKFVTGTTNPIAGVKFLITDSSGKLIAGGIPPEQIAFIHDANTEAKKKELFAKVRAGQVRVLMGSTFKMGAGMNVQDRLVALHDLDCPWRPGDLEQRKGRIVRQGNKNKTVHVYRYVTNGTFDSYLWQTVENKQKFISQIMTSKSPVRSCEDVDETALSYAEIKALCAGNPLIREKMDLDIDVARLKLLKADHQSKQFRLEDDLLKRFPEQIKQAEGFIAGFEADIKTVAEHPHPKDGFAGLTIRGDTLTDKDNAGAALLAACKEVVSSDPIEIGSYRGFSVSLSVENFGHDYILTMKGQMQHRITLGKDPKGNFVRMDNALSGIPDRLLNANSNLENLQKQMAEAKAELGKPFPQEEELRQKSARLDMLNIQLNIDSTPERGEEQIAKSERPSVLGKLSAPLPVRQTGGAEKAKRREQER